MNYRAELEAVSGETGAHGNRSSPPVLSCASGCCFYHCDLVECFRPIESLLACDGGKGVTGWDDEYRFRKADGAYATVLDRGFVLRNERGQAIRMIGAMLNITERRQAEEALRVNEARLRVALDATPVVEFNQDKELRYTWIYNSKLAVPAEQFLGKTDADLLPAEAATSLTAIKRQVLESGAGIRRRVHSNIYDKPTPCDLTVEPLRDDSGSIIGITGASIEVTDQQHQDVVHARPNPHLQGE